MTSPLIFDSQFSNDLKKLVFVPKSYQLGIEKKPNYLPFCDKCEPFSHEISSGILTNDKNLPWRALDLFHSFILLKEAKFQTFLSYH